MRTQFNLRRFLPYPLPRHADAPPLRGTGDPRFVVNNLSVQTLPKTSVAPVQKIKHSGYMQMSARGRVVPMRARKMNVDAFTIGIIRTRRSRRR